MTLVNATRSIQLLFEVSLFLWYPPFVLEARLAIDSYSGRESALTKRETQYAYCIVVVNHGHLPVSSNQAPKVGATAFFMYSV